MRVAWLRSLRGRLTLINLVVLSASLLLFGVFLIVANARSAYREVDLGLERRATGPPGPQPRGPRNAPEAPEFSREFRFGGDRAPDEAPQSAYDADALALVRGQGHIWSTCRIDGRNVRVFTILLDRGPDAGQIVQTARDLTPIETEARNQFVVLLLVFPVALLASGAAALFLTNRALRPVAEVTRAAAQISERNMSERLPELGADELGALASTFNEMLARLEASFRRTEGALEEQRRFTADASHELRTPLTRLRLATSTALQSANSEAELLNSLKVADKAGAQMGAIVEQLLLLARSDAGALALNRVPMDLRVTVADAIDGSPEPGRIKAEFPEDPVSIFGDAEHLRRAVLNVLDNALKYSQEEVEVRIEQGSNVRIVVCDHGSGVPPEALSRLGERFFRVDEARSREAGGYGIGLSIVKAIVAGHRGSVEFQSELGKGTTVILNLPGGKVPEGARSS